MNRSFFNHQWLAGILSVVFVLCFVVTVYALDQVPSVSNRITEALVTQENLMLVSGILEREGEYSGPVYALVSINGQDYRPIDQVRSSDAYVLDESTMVVNYAMEFRLNVPPGREDQVVMVWRDNKGMPLDVDPVIFDAGSYYADESYVPPYRITQCRHDQDIDTIFCSYVGSVSDWLEVAWYQNSVYDGKQVSRDTLDIVRDQDVFSVKTAALPKVEDLYLFVIKDTIDGRTVYQGSSRVGDYVVPELASSTVEELDAITSYEDNFMKQISGLTLGFVGLMAAASLVFLGRSSRRYTYAGMIIVLSLGLGVWLIAQAAVYKSEDYHQYRYSISVDPKGGDEYWVSFAAIDTHTSTPPQDQHVQITFNGTDFQDLIVDNAGGWAHVRSITIPPSASSTAAVRIVGGCASYFGFSKFSTATYGVRDCAPIALFPSEDSIIGCMDPGASNYNPDAVIESRECAYTGCTDPVATNYDPDAIINDGSCEFPSCYWTPSLPDPSTYCESEIYYQTETCTGETRGFQGTMIQGWQPAVNPSDVCVGYSVVQTELCSSDDPDPTRVIDGTGTGPFCITPETDFVVSTNLVNWTRCSDVERLQFVRPDQKMYLRSVGNEDIDSWTVNQLDGEIAGDISEHGDEVYQIAFDYTVEQKRYENIQITGTSLAGNRTEQSCNLIVLDIDIIEE